MWEGWKHHFIDEDLRDRIVDANAIEVPFAPEDRDDAHACLGMLHLEQRRLGMRTGAINGDAIEVNAECGEMEVEVLQMYGDAETLSSLLLNQVNEIRVTARTVHQNCQNDSTEKNGKHNDHAEEPCCGEQGASEGPTDLWFAGITAAANGTEQLAREISSECLADADEVLR